MNYNYLSLLSVARQSPLVYILLDASFDFNGPPPTTLVEDHTIKGSEVTEGKMDMNIEIFGESGSGAGEGSRDKVCAYAMTSLIQSAKDNKCNNLHTLDRQSPPSIPLGFWRKCFQ